MMNSPLGKYVGMASWFLCGIGALNVGLNVFFGYDLIINSVTMSIPGFDTIGSTVVYALIGLSGALSLVHWGMAVANKGCASCSCR